MGWSRKMKEAASHNFIAFFFLTTLALAVMAPVMMARAQSSTTGATNEIVISSDEDPSSYGDTVIIAAAVETNDVAAGDATSNMVFWLDGSAVATNALTSGVATCTNNALTVGAHNIQAFYSGDNNYTNNVSTNLIQMVNLATPNLAVSNSQSIAYGTASVALGGTLSAANGAAVPEGETVKVTINGTSVPATISDTTGDFSLTFPTAGIPASGTAYLISYAYAGDSNFNGVTNSSTTLIVGQAASGWMY
ncbi:MAG: Ig-like domain-containing protein, partial [Limisphaerales bacterium]